MFFFFCSFDAIRSNNISARYKKSEKKQNKKEYQILLEEYIMKKIGIVFFHNKYMMSMKPSRSFAYEFYQSGHFQTINNFMRSGEIEIDLWPLIDTGKLNKLFAFAAPNVKTTHDMKQIAKQKDAEFRILFDKFLNEQKQYVTKIENSICILKDIIRKSPKLKNIKPFYIYRGSNIYTGQFEEEEDNSKSSKLLTKHMSKQLNLEVNETFEEKSFVSFSIAPWVAARFSNLNICCLYRLQISSGSKFPYLIFPLSQIYKEFEILLNPSTFMVVNVHNVKSKISSNITMKIYDIEWVSEIK